MHLVKLMLRTANQTVCTRSRSAFAHLPFRTSMQSIHISRATCLSHFHAYAWCAPCRSGWLLLVSIWWSVPPPWRKLQLEKGATHLSPAKRQAKQADLHQPQVRRVLLATHERATGPIRWLADSRVRRSEERDGERKQRAEAEDGERKEAGERQQAWKRRWWCTRDCIQDW